jgi:hypothetical protein
MRGRDWEEAERIRGSFCASLEATVVLSLVDPGAFCVIVKRPGVPASIPE